MPMVNYHSARQNDPDKYSDFRYKEIDGAKGLFFVLGLYTKDGETKSEVQTVRADSRIWSVSDFKQWLKDNDFMTDKIEEAKGEENTEKSIQLFSMFTSFDIEKGKEEPEKVKIGGIISTDTKDQQGDILLQEGMDWSYFLKRGFFNYEHQQGPENILGVPDKVELVEIDGKKATKVEGYLLLKTPKAKSVYEAIKAINEPGTNRQIGFSVEGQVLERDAINPKIVKRAKILNVSVTAHPVNPDAKLELLARSLMALEEKGMIGYQESAQAGAGDLSALVPQSIEGKPANASYELEIDNIVELMKRAYEDMLIEKGELDDLSMTLRQARLLSSYASKLEDLLESMPENQDLPEWVQSKITKALDYTQASFHYLKVENNNESMVLEEKDDELEIEKKNVYKKKVMNTQELAVMLQAKFPTMSVSDARKLAERMMKMLNMRKS